MYSFLNINVVLIHRNDIMSVKFGYFFYLYVLCTYLYSIYVPHFEQELIIQISLSILLAMGLIICSMVSHQRFVSLGSESITFDIISGCFESKNNNCCDTKFCKNAVSLLVFTNLQIHFWLHCG